MAILEPDISDVAHALTPRQTEVVRLAALGLTAKETARRLGISKTTVDEHLTERGAVSGGPAPNRIWSVWQSPPGSSPDKSRRVAAGAALSEGRRLLYALAEDVVVASR